MYLPGSCVVNTGLRSSVIFLNLIDKKWLFVEWYFLLQDNKVPLQLAYDNGHKDVVSYLAKKTADIDPIQIKKVLFS